MNLGIFLMAFFAANMGTLITITMYTLSDSFMKLRDNSFAWKIVMWNYLTTIPYYAIISFLSWYNVQCGGIAF